MGEFPSGQRGQTVNLLALPSVVRIHLRPFTYLLRVTVPARMPVSYTHLDVYKRQAFLHVIRVVGSSNACTCSLINVIDHDIILAWKYPFCVDGLF